MGRRARKPKGYRDIDGILLLDKPLGLSSNKALQVARSIFKANKAGHTGSLDPLATGMLPICFGEATKYSGLLLDSSKTYRAICTLGVITSTGDGEGEVIERNPIKVDESLLNTVLEQFRGMINQVPPMHSALKHDGQRLYALARQGVEVERKSREVEIFSLELIDFEGDQLILDVHCSKGTYIRTLAEDIGQSLGCGAYLSGLVRTGVQPFWDQKQWTLDDLRRINEDPEQKLDDCLLPIEQALTDWPEVEVTADMGFYLLQGQPVQIPGAPTNGLVRIFQIERGFIGLGSILSDGRVAPKRMIRV